MSMNSQKLESIVQKAYSTDLVSQVNELNKFIRENGANG